MKTDSINNIGRLSALFIGAVLAGGLALSGCSGSGRNPETAAPATDGMEAEATERPAVTDAVNDGDGETPEAGGAEETPEVEYPDGTVVLSSTTSANGSGVIQQQEKYIYDGEGHLVQKVTYKRSAETGELEPYSFTNYYFLGSSLDYVEDSGVDPWLVQEECENVLGSGGEIADIIRTEYAYNERGSIIGKYITEPNDSGADDCDDYTYIWDETGSFIKEEVNDVSKGGKTYHNVTEYIYDTSGASPVLIESNHTPGSALGTPTRTVYSYDGRGLCVSEIKTVAYDGGYEDFEKTEYEYDGAGRMVRKAEYDADFGDYIHPQEGTETRWVSGSLYKWGYDSLGHLLYYSWKTDGLNTLRQEYVYGDAASSTELLYPY